MNTDHLWPIYKLAVSKREVERLTRRLALAEKTIECFENDRIEQEKENERLRAALRDLLEHAEATTPVGWRDDNIFAAARAALQKP